ncbi:MAG: class I SAM-dependent methyltransferase [Candidatus Zambryskibacteria bacterium]|nr:class I SAM-dependent methyltransferase [Candidatus Zambryskibacteria bacterium]
MKSEKIYTWIGSLTPFYDYISALVGYKKSVHFFVSQLPFSKDASFKVLDAGCGTGVYSLAILEQYKNSSVTAFDFSEKMLQGFEDKVSKKYADRLRLFTANIQSPLHEIEYKKFDLILTGGVLEYVPHEALLHENQQTHSKHPRAQALGCFLFHSHVT